MCADYSDTDLSSCEQLELHLNYLDILDNSGIPLNYKQRKAIDIANKIVPISNKWKLRNINYKKGKTWAKVDNYYVEVTL